MPDRPPPPDRPRTSNAPPRAGVSRAPQAPQRAFASAPTGIWFFRWHSGHRTVVATAPSLSDRLAFCHRRSVPVELAGPDDLLPGVDGEALRLLLSDIFSAAGGTHDDWDEYDRVMASERRVAVLVHPERTYGRS